MTSARQGIARSLVACIFIAALINGSVTWLRGVGWIDTDQYRQFVENNAAFQQHARAYHRAPENYSERQIENLRQQYRQNWQAQQSFLYATPVELVYTRLLKYLVILALVVTGLAQLARDRQAPVTCPELTVLALLVSIMILVSGSRFGWQAALAGIFVQTTIFTALAARFMRGIGTLRCVGLGFALSLALLLAMAPVEYWRGLQYFTSGGFFDKRITGFMLQPSSLGIYAACAFAFMAAVRPRPATNKTVIFGFAAAAVLVLLSGSATAVLALCVFAGFIVFGRSRQKPGLKRLAGLAVLILATAALALIDRDFFGSAGGRLAKYASYFSMDHTLTQLLFGRGAGVGSNLLHNLHAFVPAGGPAKLPVRLSTDSTPLLLLIETGFAGCLLFYAVLLRVAWTDTFLRPVYAVFAFCSLGVNLIEMFPLNVILGLMLAHSLDTVTPPAAVTGHREAC